MTIRDANGRDITDDHFREQRITDSALESSRRAFETANARPSGKFFFKPEVAAKKAIITNDTALGRLAMEAAMADTIAP